MNSNKSSMQKLNCCNKNLNPLPALYPDCFSQFEADRNPTKKLKTLRPKLVFTVPPENEEKRVTISRNPLVIEYLKNNWVWHGRDREDDSSDKRPKKPMARSSNSPILRLRRITNIQIQEIGRGVNTNARIDNHEQQTGSDEVELARSSQERTDFSGIYNHSNGQSIPEEDQNGITGMGEITDRLQRTKRRHLSLAEQALMAMEEEVGGTSASTTNGQHSINGSPSHSADGKNERGNEAIEAPPPAKHGRSS